MGCSCKRESKLYVGSRDDYGNYVEARVCPTRCMECKDFYYMGSIIGIII